MSFCSWLEKGAFLRKSLAFHSWPWAPRMTRPRFLGTTDSPEMKKSGIGQQCQRLTLLIQSRYCKSQHFGCSIFHQPGRLIRCIFHDSYDSITWQEKAPRFLRNIWEFHATKVPQLSTFCSSSNLWRISVQAGAMLTYTCEGQILASHQPLAPEINWTTWVFLPKYEWNIFKPSKNGVFACLLYMMTREINPTAEKKGPVQHAQFRSCGEPFQITCLAHRASWRILLKRHSPFICHLNCFAGNCPSNSRTNTCHLSAEACDSFWEKSPRYTGLGCWPWKERLSTIPVSQLIN